MKAIEITNLTKSYGKNRGIIDLSFTVEEGDFFGFIGPNGAGKSTTIRTMLGLIKKNSGFVKVFGKEVGKEQKDILSNIGYLPSETMFYSNMSVMEVLEFSANLRGKDCREEREKLCKRLELDTKRKICELSLGNRKKVGIVCAMQHNPKLYIMDEPTSGLDPLIQKEFYTLLQEKNQEGGTIFLSSHVLSEVQKYCKHALLIREGRFIVLDTVDNLSATGTKHVVIKGVDTIPNFHGVQNVYKGEDYIQFFYKGNTQKLLDELSKLPLLDISIKDPELEEIFLHYYEKE